MCKSLIKITNINESNKCWHPMNHAILSSFGVTFSDLIKNQRDKTLLFVCPFTVRLTHKTTINFNNYRSFEV